MCVNIYYFRNQLETQLLNYVVVSFQLNQHRRDVSTNCVRNSYIRNESSFHLNTGKQRRHRCIFAHYFPRRKASVDNLRITGISYSHSTKDRVNYRSARSVCHMTGSVAGYNGLLIPTSSRFKYLIN